MIPTCLKTAKLAELLDVSPDTLHRLKNQGVLRPIRIGRDLHWPVREVEAWLESQRVDYSRPVLLSERRRAS